jgi:hypothetical protein
MTTSGFPLLGLSYSKIPTMNIYYIMSTELLLINTDPQGLPYPVWNNSSAPNSPTHQSTGQAIPCTPHRLASSGLSRTHQQAALATGSRGLHRRHHRQGDI